MTTFLRSKAISSIFDTALQLKNELSKPPVSGSPPVWTRGMTIALIALPFVLALLHLGDASISRGVTASQFPGLGFLRSITDLIRTVLWLSIAILAWLATAILIAPATKPKTSLGLLQRGRPGLIALHGWATLIIGATLIGSIPLEIGKYVVGRARPYLIDSVGDFAFSPFRGEFLYESFPSGHSMSAGIMLMSLWIWLPRWRIVTVPVILLMAFSRIAVGAHYPTDVVAGLFVGVVATLCFSRFLAARNIIFTTKNGSSVPVR